MKAFAIAATAVTIAAAPPEGYPVRGDTGHHCEAGRAKALTGRRRSLPMEQQALRLSGAAIVRWIPKGSAVTMDYRPDRLNLRLDGRARIRKINCG